MNILNKKFQPRLLLTAIVTIIAPSLSYTGSLVKIDISKQAALVDFIQSAKLAYKDKFAERFIESNFLPHATLLFLSASNDGADIEVKTKSSQIPAEIILAGAKAVAKRFSTINFSSKLKISHLPGAPSGVPGP